MPKTLLIFLFGDLGDTLLTVPAIRALRDRYPHACMVLLSKEGTGSIVSGLHLVDDVITMDKHILDRVRDLLNPRAYLEVGALLWKIRRVRPDTVVIFGHTVTGFGALKYALLSLASGAGRRVGLDNGKGWFLTDRARDEGFGLRHEAQYALDVASLLDATGNLDLELPVSDADRQVASRLLASAGTDGPLIALHPGTGWYGQGRKWDPEHFAEVGDILSEQTAARLVVVGSREDRTDADKVLTASTAPIHDLVGKTTVGELGAVLQRCDLVLANDGGVGHVAAAVGTPVLSIFGPSNDDSWKPLTATVMAADLPCRPCFYRGYERGLPNGCGPRQCLQLVTPSAVARTALDLLRRQQRRAV